MVTNSGDEWKGEGDLTDRSRAIMRSGQDPRDSILGPPAAVTVHMPALDLPKYIFKILLYK